MDIKDLLSPKVTQKTNQWKRNTGNLNITTVDSKIVGRHYSCSV